MPVGYVLCGLPASGKSTWIENDFRNFWYPDEDLNISWKDFVILSTDNIIDEYAKSVGKTYDEVFNDYIKIAEKIFLSRFDEAVKEGKNIIVDRTHLNVNSRAKTLSKFNSNYVVTAIAFKTPDFKEHKRRLDNRPGKTIPDHVMTAMTKNASLPSIDEGFTFVFWSNGEDIR